MRTVPLPVPYKQNPAVAINQPPGSPQKNITQGLSRMESQGGEPQTASNGQPWRFHGTRLSPNLVLRLEAALAWGEEGAAEVAWVAGELGHPAEVLGTKAVPGAGQSPRKDKVLGRQALGGQAGRDSYPTTRRALREGR